MGTSFRTSSNSDTKLVRGKVLLKVLGDSAAHDLCSQPTPKVPNGDRPYTSIFLPQGCQGRAKEHWGERRRHRTNENPVHEVCHSSNKLFPRVAHGSVGEVF